MLCPLFFFREDFLIYMPQKIFQAKQYATRKQLEADVRRNSGGDSHKKQKTDFVIKGKKEDLKRLRLSTTSTVFGVSVEEN